MGSTIDVLFLHGHQADPVCYGWRARINRWLVRNLWRGVQNFGIGDPTRAAENPGRCNATDAELMKLARGEAAQVAGGFAARRPAIVVAGHTHRPVFEGLSLSERRLLESGFGPPGIVRKEKAEAIYYNSGSCVHPRCITGIEITGKEDADGTIRPHFSLVKWSIEPASSGDRKPLAVTRTVLN